MRLLAFLMALGMASVAWCEERIFTIAGTVESVSGDLTPGPGVRNAPKKRVASNVVVYAIPAQLLSDGVPLRRDDVMALTLQANAYDVTDEQGRFHLPVTGGRAYRVLAVIGPAVHVAAGDVVDRAANNQSIVIDRTTR